MRARSKLGIIAGGGDLPAMLIAACQTIGRPFHVLAIEGHADPEKIGAVPGDWVRLGAAGEAFSRLHAAGVGDIVLAGRVRRPTLRELRPDRRAARFLATGLLNGGDDRLLGAVVRELEEKEGFHVVGIDAILEGLLAPAGAFGEVDVAADAWEDIRRGIAVARALGSVDVGQAVTVQQGVVLGVETVEGTDALLRRCAGLGRAGAGGVLVKLAKIGQERRVDLPTIGATTVRLAAEAGLRGIAVEADAALVVGRAAVVREADARGLFVVGVRPGDLAA